MIAPFLSGLGAAAPAGLNATLPLLILALADRLTGAVNLGQPYDLISSTWGIIVLLFILPIELIADKIARVDHANDLLHTAIRPAAGALMMMAVTSQNDHINPVVSLILGLLLAGAIHWYKTTNRPAVTIATKGLGNPVLSIAEDGAVIVCTIVALFIPYGVIVVLPLCAWFVHWSYKRFKTGEVRLGGLLGPARRA
ncbi:MAG: DUF4126 domain-containing protein [Thermomicrobiales bacterium]